MGRDEEERRRFALGAPTGTVQGVDVALLDGDAEDERRLLVLADHPDLQGAIAAGKREVERGGEVISPELHLRCT